MRTGFRLAPDAMLRPQAVPSVAISELRNWTRPKHATFPHLKLGFRDFLRHCNRFASAENRQKSIMKLRNKTEAK